jgi:transposase
MGAMTTIVPELAKKVFQVHGVNAEGRVLVRRRLRRASVLNFFNGPSPMRARIVLTGYESV